MSGLLPRADFRTSPTQVSKVPQAGIGPSIRQHLLPHLKIFFCTHAFHRKATLFSRQTVFGQVFGRGGMSKFQNPTVPPTGGPRRSATCRSSRIWFSTVCASVTRTYCAARLFDFRHRSRSLNKYEEVAVPHESPHSSPWRLSACPRHCRRARRVWPR
jgi:hypothetical protein